jgi:selenide,water dikinase
MAMRAAIASRVTLNAAAAKAAVDLGVEVHAATDVTGYGLVGHLGEMLRASDGVSARLSAAALPVLAGARELAADGVLAGGTKANRAFAEDRYRVADGVDEALAWIACDAQTSGGLLVACPPAHAAALVAALAAAGSPAAVVGVVTGEPGATVTLDR